MDDNCPRIALALLVFYVAAGAGIWFYLKRAAERDRIEYDSPGDGDVPR